MKNKDQILLEQAYQSIYLNEQEAQGVITQQQLTELYKKGKPLQFIKNTPVALATVEQLSKSVGEEKSKEVLKHAGSVDKTSYDQAWQSKGYVVFQWNSKTNEPDIYIADPQVVAQKYTKFEGALPTDEKAKSKIPSLNVLKHLGIDSSKVPLFVKKVPTNMIKVDDVGLANKVIQTSWGEQTIQSGGFLVKEDNGHIYTVAPDQQGLPIGYISSGVVYESLEENFEDFQGKTLKDYVSKGDGTKKDPFIAKSWTDIYVLAGFLKDLSNANDKKEYFYKFNDVLYKANGQNKLIKIVESLTDVSQEAETLLSSLTRDEAKQQISQILQKNPELVAGLKQFQQQDPEGYKKSLSNFNTNGVSEHLVKKMAQGKHIGYYDFM